MVDERTAGVFLGRVREPAPYPRRLPLHLGGELFRRLQVGEPLDAPHGAGRVPEVEVPALGRSKVLRPVLRDSVKDQLAALPEPDVRLTGHVHEFGISRERKRTGRLERLGHLSMPLSPETAARSAVCIAGPAAAA